MTRAQLAPQRAPADHAPSTRHSSTLTDHTVFPDATAHRAACRPRHATSRYTSRKLCPKGRRQLAPPHRGGDEPAHNRPKIARSLTNLPATPRQQLQTAWLPPYTRDNNHAHRNSPICHRRAPARPSTNVANAIADVARHTTRVTRHDTDTAPTAPATPFRPRRTIQQHAPCILPCARCLCNATCT